MVMPLVTDSTGKKFGKTEGNALWLDKNKTSSYALYQYLINLEDSMIIKYLKMLTFLSKEEIEDLEKKHNAHPELREAHKALAREIITDLHGKEEYEKALKISECLFTEKINELSSDDILNNLNDVPRFTFKDNINIVDLLVDKQVCSSKREAREMVSGNAISINNQKVSDLEKVITKNDLIDHKVMLLKKGKKNYYVGVIE
jgi:tyrosyl-tRNA synthetase